MNFLFRIKLLNAYFIFYILLLVVALLKAEFIGLKGHVRIFHMPIFYINTLMMAFIYYVKSPKVNADSLILFSFALIVTFNVGHVRDFAQWAPYIIMFYLYPFIYLSINNMSRYEIIYFVDKYVLLMVIVVVLGPVYYLLGNSQYHVNPYSSLGINRNAMSYLYWIAFVFQYTKLLYCRNWINILFFSILLLGILFTYSRIVYVMALFTLLLGFGLVHTPRTLINNLGGIIRIYSINRISIVFGLVLVLFLAYSTNPWIPHRVGQLIEVVDILNFGEEIARDDSGGRKQLLMMGSLNVFLENPFFGVGAGQSWLNLPEFVYQADRGGSAHNAYLRILAEYGIVGAILLSTFYVRVLKRSFRRLKVIRSNSYVDYDDYVISHSLFVFVILLPVFAMGSEYIITHPLSWLFLGLSSFYLNGTRR
jgi:O-antigen ligase